MTFSESLHKALESKDITIENSELTSDKKNYSKIVNLLSKTVLYKCAISYKCPTLKTQVSFESFFKIKDDKLKGKMTKPLISNFRKIAQIINHLMNLRTKVYNNMVNCEPFGWVCSENNLSELQEDLEELETYYAKIPSLISKYYKEDFKNFLLKIIELGVELDFSEEYITQLINIYSDKYPTKLEVINSFNLVIFYPEKIPELIDVFRNKNELLQEEVNKEKIVLQKKNQEAYYTSLSEGIKYVQKELFLVISNILVSLSKETTKPGKLNKHTEKTIASCIVQIQKYLSWDEDLNDLLEDVKKLQNTSSNEDTSKAELNQIILEVKKKLENDYKYTSDKLDSIGHRTIPIRQKQ